MKKNSKVTEAYLTLEGVRTLLSVHATNGLDADGSRWWFENEPRTNELRGEWVVDEGLSAQAGHEDWVNSLERLP